MKSTIHVMGNEQTVNTVSSAIIAEGSVKRINDNPLNYTLGFDTMKQARLAMRYAYKKLKKDNPDMIDETCIFSDRLIYSDAIAVLKLDN